jgi:hypothetical protein
MKKLLLILLICFGLNVKAQNCTDLFISEYVEGWSNNKAIELYNPTHQPIDLSYYSLSKWSNGSTVPQSTILEGTIEPYSAFVIGLDKTDPNGEGYESPLWNGWLVFTDPITGMLDSIYSDEANLMDRIDLFICPTYSDGTMYYNGNDAVTLETVYGDILDVIGVIGEDPGEAWSDSTGAYWTKDQTLIRKSTVEIGAIYESNIGDTFDPSVEWDALPANTFINLGTHICDCSVSGCTSNWADNFNPQANNNDGSCIRLGCISEWADNYDYLATVDDASCELTACPYPYFIEYDSLYTIADNSMCITFIIEGCIDSLSINYDESANTDNGSCIPLIIGCTDTTAFNYISTIDDSLVDVNTENDSCYPFIEGCLDESAFNFIAITGNNQEDVNTDDGTCYPFIYGCMDILAFNYISPIGDILVDVNTDNGVCTPVVEGCISNWADNYNPEVNTPQNDLCVREGCMNYTAMNYDSLATLDNDSCIIDGCTISLFPNYNPLATVDFNQSCDLNSSNVWGCNNDEACNYNLDVNIDNGSCQVPELGFDCEDNFVGFELTVDFDDINLDTNSNWNGSDLSGAYVEEGFNFVNNYDSAWGSWSGFAVSNVTDNLTEGWGNLYGVSTGNAFSGDNFAVATIGASISSEARVINGFYITNSTFAALSMLNGDNFAKKFGGVSGDDADWFKLTVIGKLDLVVTDTVEFYLADYRFEDNTEDYIVTDWTWLDLSTLGEVTDISFSWSSSDNGDWGMNTPAYFCMEDLTTSNNSGCTDSTAFNFNPEAIDDNGNCTPFSYGCMDVNACNYNSQINSDDNSCVYSIDLNECATCSGEANGSGVIVENDIDNDGTCDGNEIDGCQDMNALNYSIEATEEDNSCVYSGEIYNDLDSTVNVIQESLTMYQQALNSWNTTIGLVVGWNMFGYGCPEIIDVVEALSDYTQSIVIVKDNDGSVYLPEFSFNGIGDFTSGYGYQIKLVEAIEDFSLCDWYLNDIPEDNFMSIQEEITLLEAKLDSLNSLACIEDSPVVFWGAYQFLETGNNPNEMLSSVMSETPINLSCDGTWTGVATYEMSLEDNYNYILFPSSLGGINSIFDPNGFNLQGANPTWLLYAIDVEVDGYDYTMDIYISPEDAMLMEGDTIIID